MTGTLGLFLPALFAVRDAISVNVSPNSSLPGTNSLEQLVGGLQLVSVIAAVAGIVIGAAVWALSSHANNYQGASRGRAAVLASVIAALLIGAGPYLVEQLFGLGQSAH